MTNLSRHSEATARSLAEASPFIPRTWILRILPRPTPSLTRRAPDREGASSVPGPAGPKPARQLARANRPWYDASIGVASMRIMLVMLAGVAGLVRAQSAPPPFLQPARLPDMVSVLPPPPVFGGPTDKRDRHVFRRTRALKDSPRWRMATADAEIAPEKMLTETFACALDSRVDPARVPILLSLLTRFRDKASSDAIIGAPKAYWDRRRPFVRWRDDTICVPANDEYLRKAGEYPSGHATLGYATALILTEIAPERATQILARGRAYGESRVVCGVHTPDAVEAGRTNAAAWVATLHGSAEFRAALEAARAEFAQARAAPAPPPASCAAEAALVAEPVYDGAERVRAK